jgi:hypothetical protein
MAGEIVTKGARFYCVSLQPDICKTPNGPSTPAIPYMIKGEFSEATGVARGITSNQEPVVVHASTVIPTVTGDEKGTAKGVKSKTVGKRVQHDQRSSTVSFNGERAIRVGDTVFMNDKNTIGKVYERSAPPPAAPAREGHAARPPEQSMEPFEDRFNRAFALLASPKSGHVNAAVGAAAGTIAGIPFWKSSIGIFGKPDAGDHDAPHAAAPRTPDVLDQVRSVSGLIPSELLTRVPGLAAVAKFAASAAGTNAVRPSSPPNNIDASTRVEVSRAAVPSGQISPGKGSAANSGGAGGSDGGTSRGKARPPSPAPDGNVRPRRAGVSGDTITRTRVDALREFPDFPAWGARILVDNQVTVYRVNDNVVEAFPWLHGRHPPGHALDVTYDQITGVYLDEVASVAIAPDSKRPSASFHTPFHELAHAVNSFGGFSSSENFREAWGKDYAALGSDYFRGAKSGYGEAFAEGFARYYGRQKAMPATWPHIYKYFEALDRCMANGKSGC